MSETDPLREEHEAEQREARHQRRLFGATKLGAFARAMLAALREYFTMRAAGVSREDGVKGLEAVLRDAWPQRPSKFAPSCLACDDTGWYERICSDEMRCGREFCYRRGSAHQHTYATPCDCARGDAHRPRVHTPESELASVGRSKPKQRKFSRMGV